jgi:hypothetical protein
VLKRLTNGAEDHVGHYFQAVMTAIVASVGPPGHPEG